MKAFEPKIPPILNQLESSDEEKEQGIGTLKPGEGVERNIYKNILDLSLIQKCLSTANGSSSLSDGAYVLLSRGIQLHLSRYIKEICLKRVHGSKRDISLEKPSEFMHQNPRPELKSPNNRRCIAHVEFPPESYLSPMKSKTSRIIPIPKIITPKTSPRMQFLVSPTSVANDQLVERNVCRLYGPDVKQILGDSTIQTQQYDSLRELTYSDLIYAFEVLYEELSPFPKVRQFVRRKRLIPNTNPKVSK